MNGRTNYLYQLDTPPTAVRMEDQTLQIADFAAARHEENPNSRTVGQHGVVGEVGMGRRSLAEGRPPVARLYFDDQHTCPELDALFDNGGRAAQVRE
jgi:hypothetical protein